MSLDPAELVDTIRRCVAVQPGSDPVIAYWYQVSGSRNEFADAVREAAADASLVPLVVLGRFQNPNELMSDLYRLICDNQSALESVPVPVPERPLVLLLLSHVEFQLPQIASPTYMPDWFPGLGNRTVLVRIEDLTWRADISVKSPKARVREVCGRLYELDRTITCRLEVTAAANHNNCAGLIQELREKKVLKDGGTSFEVFLSRAREHLAGIQDQTSYRLELRNPPTPLAAVVRIASATAPDELGILARHVARALVVANDSPLPKETLPALLACTTNNDNKDRDRLVGQNLILTAYTTHRLSTIESHAQNLRYPITLLRSLSLELREGLTSLSEFVSRLPAPLAKVKHQVAGGAQNEAPKTT